MPLVGALVHLGTLVVSGWRQWGVGKRRSKSHHSLSGAISSSTPSLEISSDAAEVQEPAEFRVCEVNRIGGIEILVAAIGSQPGRNIDRL